MPNPYLAREEQMWRDDHHQGEECWSPERINPREKVCIQQRFFCKKCDVLLLSISLTDYSIQMIVQTQSRHCCYDHLKERSTHTSHWSQFPKEEAVLSLSRSMIHNYMTQVFQSKFLPMYVPVHMCVHLYTYIVWNLFLRNNKEWEIM